MGEVVINYTIDENKCLYLELNRPEKANAITKDMFQLIIDIIKQKEFDALIIQGKGEHFSAGADLKEMANLTPQNTLAYTETIENCLASIADLAQPVIAICHGYAAGAGVGICAVSDLIIATKEAKFACPEIKSKIAPAIIAPYVINKIGLNQAKAMFLTGIALNAQEAYAKGFVDIIAESSDVKITDFIPCLATATKIKAMLRNKEFGSNALSDYILSGLKLSKYTL